MPSGGRRLSGRPRRPPSRSSGRRRPPRRGPRWALILAALIAAGGAHWLYRRATSPPLLPPGPTSALSAEEANARAIELAHAGHHLEAIPYFRRVVAQDPGSWTAHENLAGALGNGAQQARTRFGKDEISTRSSVERVAMMRESIAETEAAARLAPTPGSRAVALFEHGRGLQTWGFPIEALTFFRAAARLAPQRADMIETLRRAEQDLKGTGS